MSFGLLSYDTVNLGDEMQSLAAQRFLPSVDVLLHRDALDAAPSGDGPVHAILNGWFLGKPEHWPPHPRIVPLLLSMHFDHKRSRKRFWRAPTGERLLSPAGREWLTANGPVGARDRATLALLEAHGIPAWFSGCLTLTLPRGEPAREDYIVACDIPAGPLAELRRRTRRNVIAVTHRDATTRGHEPRMAKARGLLALYARAHAVVTTRLHCALPCISQGTPVLFAPGERDPERLQLATEFARVTTLAELASGRHDFDFDAPPPNPDGWQPVARALAERCTAFVAAAQAKSLHASTR